MRAKIAKVRRIAALDPKSPVTTGSLWVAQFIFSKESFVADFNVIYCKKRILGLNILESVVRLHQTSIAQNIITIGFSKIKVANKVLVMI
jgi:hypothetical protein